MIYYNEYGRIVDHSTMSTDIEPPPGNNTWEANFDGQAWNMVETALISAIENSSGPWPLKIRLYQEEQDRLAAEQAEANRLAVLAAQTAEEVRLQHIAYAYDTFGWYAGEVQVGSPRSTKVIPPSTPNKVVGQDYPNFTGHEWVMVPYSEYVPPEPVPEPEPVNHWWIYVGAFHDRFKQHLIPILADPDAVVQAIVKTLSVRKYVDLRRPDVAGMVDTIILKGYAINKTEILETVPTDLERYKGAA